jgi:hypothetical protein
MKTAKTKMKTAKTKTKMKTAETTTDEIMRRR